MDFWLWICFCFLSLHCFPFLFHLPLPCSFSSPLFCLSLHLDYETPKAYFTFSYPFFLVFPIVFISTQVFIFCPHTCVYSASAVSLSCYPQLAGSWCCFSLSSIIPKPPFSSLSPCIQSPHFFSEPLSSPLLPLLLTWALLPISYPSSLSVSSSSFFHLFPPLYTFPSYPHSYCCCPLSLIPYGAPLLTLSPTHMSLIPSPDPLPAWFPACSVNALPLPAGRWPILGTPCSFLVKSHPKKTTFLGIEAHYFWGRRVDMGI